jgi:hypothetical protein
MRPTVPIAVIALLFSLASAAMGADTRPGGADRRVNGHAVISAHDPRVTLTLPRAFRSLGEDRWLLGGFDDAEMHPFVDADKAGNVRRLFWVQFEAYVPERPELHHTYDSPTHATIGGLDFYVDTWVRAADEAVDAGSDRDHLEKALVARGLKTTPAMMYVRFVHLPDAARRKELMIIYGEALKPDGPSAADLSPGGAHASEWPAMADALIRRAEAQIRLN